jgi:hypothetical protein
MVTRQWKFERSGIVKIEASDWMYWMRNPGKYAYKKKEKMFRKENSINTYSIYSGFLVVITFLNFCNISSWIQEHTHLSLK